MTHLLLRSSLVLVAVLLTTGSAQAQDPQACPADQAVCIVANGQTLNNVISADTTASGARAREDRVYELVRDGFYLMDAGVTNTGYTLRIRGAEGDGAIPQVYTTPNPTSGNRVGTAFTQEGDIELTDLAMIGVIRDPLLNPGGFANMSVGVVTVNAPGFDLILDGVVFNDFVAQMVRTNSALQTFRMTNSIWANSGWLGTGGTNFGAGKGVDLRSGSIDTLVFQNNTFINYTDRIIRHLSSTAPIEYMVFDHNTILNAVSYHGTLSLGRVGEAIQITNNLWLDSFVAGADSSDASRQAEFNESGETYPNGEPKMTWIISEPNDETEWTVANNVYAVSDAVQAFYDQFSGGGGDDGNPDNGTDGDNDIIGMGDPLTDHIRSRLDNPAAAFVEVDLEVANRPAPPVDMVTWYRTETGRTKSTASFDADTDDFDRRDTDYFLNTFDASYATDSPAYTAAAGGCPAGDLNWFPDVNVAACLQATPSERGPEAGLFSLSNAPNPFRSGTTLRYSLEEPADVTLAVYDALGRQVAALVSAPQAAGDHTVEWGAGNVSPGVYIVRLSAGEAVATHRVLVVR